MADRTQFEINGVIDTNNSVLDNLNALANAAGCFLTWDPNEGRWIVILNTTTGSIKSFDDSNILGDINVSGSGLTELYNAVSAKFPNKDTRDTTDVVELTTPDADRFEEEIDNTLEITLPYTNDPVQAQYIAARELKQSRLDLIIEFATNFEANTLKAGDVIDVTNVGLEFTNKLFRVIQVEETDEDDGNLIFNILAQEYDEDIYTVNDLEYDYRSNFTGIKSVVFNEEIAANDDIDFGNQMARLLAANLGVGLLRSFFTSDPDTGEVLTQGIEFANQDNQELLEAGAKKPDLSHTLTDSQICSGFEVSVDLDWATDCDVCLLNTPSYTYDYTITGATASEVNVDLEGTVTLTEKTGSFSFIPTVTEPKTITVTIGNDSTAIDVSPAPEIYASNVVASSTTITEGDTITSVTVTTVGVDNGDTIDYTISGSASSKVSSPALTGTVTINSNTGTLGPIITTDNSAYNEEEELIITFTYPDEPIDYGCGLGVNSVTIIVENNDTTGPITPDIPKPGDYDCEYVQVPIIWCGTFDPDTQYIKDIEVKKYAYLPVAQAPIRATAVPTAVTITNPGTASAAISITTTTDIDTFSTGIGGASINVITSFNTPPSGGDTMITGTTTTFFGYW